MLCERTSEQWLWYDPALLWRGMTGQTGSVRSQLATSTLYSWVGPAWPPSPDLAQSGVSGPRGWVTLENIKDILKITQNLRPLIPLWAKSGGFKVQAGPTQLYTPLVTIIAEHSVSGDIVASLIISHYILIMWTIIVCFCVPTAYGMRFGNI